MAMHDIRKLAHDMLEQLDDEALAEVVENIRYVTDKQNKVSVKGNFSTEEPTREELKAIQKARKEFLTSEFLTHEDVFGEEDYV